MNLKPLDKQSIEKLNQSEEFDEEWEKVLFRLCENDHYLKKCALNISRLLSSLKISIGEKEEDIEDFIDSIISLSSVTNLEAFDKNQRVDFVDFETYKKEVLENNYTTESIHFLKECCDLLINKSQQTEPVFGKSGIVFKENYLYYKLKPQKKGVLVFYKSEKILNDFSKEKRKGMFQCKIENINQLNQLINKILNYE